MVQEQVTPWGRIEDRSSAVVEQPVRPVQVIVFDDFLAPDELSALLDFTLEHEAAFAATSVTPSGWKKSVSAPTYRRSRRLWDVGPHRAVITDRITARLPEVCARLGREPLTFSDVEIELAASNDGDFYRKHSDDRPDPVLGRILTFVYYFHREPKGFSGGELRLHDSRLENGRYVLTGRTQDIEPRRNRIVFFEPWQLHEIVQVSCPSKQFADSRFTLNGWLHK